MKVVKQLYRAPIVSVKTVERITGLSRANANNLVAKLVESKILEPTAEDVRYERQFMHEEYLKLFTNE